MAGEGYAGDMLIHRLLSDDGLATGTTSLLVDGSTPVKHWIGAASAMSITQLIIYLRDDGTWKPELFGSGTALTNGLTIDVERDSTSVIDLDNGLGIKVNADFGRYTHDVTVTTYGSGQTTLIAKLCFGELFGMPLRLDADERLVVTVNDDLSTGWTELRAVAQGYLR